MRRWTGEVDKKKCNFLLKQSTFSVVSKWTLPDWSSGRRLTYKVQICCGRGSSGRWNIRDKAPKSQLASGQWAEVGTDTGILQTDPTKIRQQWFRWYFSGYLTNISEKLVRRRLDITQTGWKSLMDCVHKACHPPGLISLCPPSVCHTV